MHTTPAVLSLARRPWQVGLDFLDFHHDNPNVWRELRRRVSQYVAQTGATRVGIQMFVELLRHDHDFQVRKHGDFKFNNDFASLYARTLMHFCPELAGVFETRTNRGEDRAGDFLAWFLAGKRFADDPFADRVVVIESVEHIRAA